MKSNSEIVGEHYNNFLHSCNAVTNCHEYSNDLCNELCLYLLEKVSNKRLNELESIEGSGSRTQLDYYFFRSAQLVWYEANSTRDRHNIKRISETANIDFKPIDKIFNLSNEEEDYAASIKDIKEALTEAEKCYIDLYITCNGYTDQMHKRTGIDVKSLKKIKNKIVRKCKKRFLT